MIKSVRHTIPAHADMADVGKQGKVTLGYKSTLKSIRTGKAKLVLIAANTPPLRKSELEYYAVRNSRRFQIRAAPDTLPDAVQDVGSPLLRKQRTSPHIFVSPEDLASSGLPREEVVRSTLEGSVPWLTRFRRRLNLARRSESFSGARPWRCWMLATVIS